MDMLPALSLAIIAPTGGDEMQMGVVRPIAAMRMEYRDGALLEHLVPDSAIDTPVP